MSGCRSAMARPGRAAPARWRRLLAAAGIALTGLAGAAACSSAPEVSEAITYTAVDVASGDPVSLADLRGRPALLSSWTTWCVPCRVELPRLEKLHEARAADGLQVVIVNIDAPGTDEGAIAAFTGKLGLTMRQWRDPDGDFTTTFRGFALPMSVLVDASGEIVHTWHGPMNPADDDVRTALDDVLAR